MQTLPYHPEGNGGMMVMMHMERVSTVDRHRREVVEVMPGRAMALLRCLFWAHREASWRALRDQTHDRGVASVVVVVVEGVAAVSADSI